MTIVAQTRPFVIGVDCHARTHTYAIIEASTKRQVACEQFPVRHRLNRGDRRLNRALLTITMTRMVYDPGTRDYVAKRTQEGRSYREIRRSLKGDIARTLHRQFNALYATAEPAPSHLVVLDGSGSVP